MEAIEFRQGGIEVFLNNYEVNSIVLYNLPLALYRGMYFIKYNSYS